MNNDLKDILDNRELKEFPFKVPENYFDTLTERIMANIPEESSTSSMKRGSTRILSLRPMRWAASIACIVAISATSILYVTRSNSGSMAMNSADSIVMPGQNSNDDIMTEAADYTMLDNQDIYMLLAED